MSVVFFFCDKKLYTPKIRFIFVIGEFLREAKSLIIWKLQ